MSQWADNTDRLNHWAESRRQFVGVSACVFFQWGGGSGFFGGLAAGGDNQSCRSPWTSEKLFFNPKHGLRITHVSLSSLDLCSPSISHTQINTVALLSCESYVLTHTICFYSVLLECCDVRGETYLLQNGLLFYLSYLLLLLPLLKFMFKKIFVKTLYYYVCYSSFSLHLGFQSILQYLWKLWKCVLIHIQISAEVNICF